MAIVTDCREKAKCMGEKRLRKIYGLLWQNRHNHEIYKLYKEMKLTKDIRLRRLQ